MPRAEWKLYIDPEDKDQTPFLVIKDPVERVPTLAEMERAVRILNEEGLNIIRLSCEKDPSHGWVERARKDADKNVYWCEAMSSDGKSRCGGKMVR